MHGLTSTVYGARVRTGEWLSQAILNPCGIIAERREKKGAGINYGIDRMALTATE